MARGGTRAIVVYGHGVQLRAGVRVLLARQSFYALRGSGVGHTPTATPLNGLDEDFR